MLLQESEWLAATEEIRRLFGQRMTSTDTFELTDVFVPAGRTGVEVWLGVDESHVDSGQGDAMYKLQDAMVGRAAEKHEVVGIFVSSQALPRATLAKALGRMGTNDVIPLTVEQAQQIASLEVDLIDALGPIRELVEVAASRPEDDLSNAADELLTNIAILVERNAAAEST